MMEDKVEHIFPFSFLPTNDHAVGLFIYLLKMLLDLFIKSSVYNYGKVLILITKRHLQKYGCKPYLIK